MLPSCSFVVVLLKKLPRTTSAKVSGAIPGHGWVPPPPLLNFFLILPQLSNYY